MKTVGRSWCAVLCVVAVAAVACGTGTASQDDLLVGPDGEVTSPEPGSEDAPAGDPAPTDLAGTDGPAAGDEATAPDETTQPACTQGDPCDDGDPCTADDKCGSDGTCKGRPLCDDGIDCTLDSCQPGGGCTHVVDKDNADCRPQIVIEQPARAATLEGAPQVTVKGVVTYKSYAWPVDAVSVNGTLVPIDAADHTFQTTLTSVHGINPVVVDLADSQGQTAHAVRSYYWSPAWTAIDAKKPAQSMVANGVQVRLEQGVFDSAGANLDLATVITLYASQMDVNTLLTNPVTTVSYAGCDYNVSVTNIAYGTPWVSLLLVKGGLSMWMYLPDFSADVSLVSLQALCPNISGTVTATSIDLDTTLLVSLDGAGNPVVTLSGTQVTIEGLDVNLNGVLGFFVNWVIDFFNSNLTSMLQDQFVTKVVPKVQDAIVKALKGLALQKTFTVPALLAGGSPVDLTLASKLSSVDFEEDAATIGMSATVVAPEVTTHTVLGSIDRSGCADAGTYAFPATGAIEAALYDDLVNQAAFGLFWGGGLKFPVDPAQFGADVSTYGVTDLDLKIDCLLPPIVTSCATGTWRIEVGDVGIDAAFSFAGTPVHLLAYASVSAVAHLAVTQSATGATVGVTIDKPEFADLEVTSAGGGSSAASDAIGSLVKEVLLPMVLNAVAGKTFGAFPIPQIDLGAIAPSLAGSVIALDLKEIGRLYGYTSASGNVK